MQTCSCDHKSTSNHHHLTHAGSKVHIQAQINKVCKISLQSAEFCIIILYSDKADEDEWMFYNMTRPRPVKRFVSDHD